MTEERITVKYDVDGLNQRGQRVFVNMPKILTTVEEAKQFAKGAYPKGYTVVIYRCDSVFRFSEWRPDYVEVMRFTI